MVVVVDAVQCRSGAAALLAVNAFRPHYSLIT